MRSGIGMAAALAFLATGAAASPPAGSTAADEEVLFVWRPTAECPDRKEGPGAAPATAIALEWFSALYDDVVDRLVQDEEQKAQTPSESQYECRWVTLSGFFEWADYYHYRGYLTADLPAAYFGGSVRYIVESFGDPGERRARLNGARIRLTGRFYDLCRRAAMDVADEALVFGPCHYGGLQGLMLRDVIIEAIEAGPNLRLKGEPNRALIGDLVATPPRWPESARVKAAFFDWIGALRAGRQAYWTTAVDQSIVNEEERAETLAEALEDEDDWISHLTQSPDSPLRRRSDSVLKRRPFRVFKHAIDADDATPFEVTACVCLSRDCDDEWPLFSQDARRFSDAYLCNELTRAGDGWRWSPQ
jgi:hypothetical protein